MIDGNMSASQLEFGTLIDLLAFRITGPSLFD
jgi:hypothetical protein